MATQEETFETERSDDDAITLTLSRGEVDALHTVVFNALKSSSYEVYWSELNEVFVTLEENLT